MKHAVDARQIYVAEIDPQGPEAHLGPKSPPRPKNPLRPKSPTRCLSARGASLVTRSYSDDWKTNGNETSTEPPAGAGKRHRATRALMQLATSASPRVSDSTSTPDTVPACVIVQWMTILPLRFGLRLRPRS